jgi:hypothetical protein
MKWEQEWQKDLDTVYTEASMSHLKAAGEALNNVASRSSSITGIMESSISASKANHRFLCRLQHEILAFVSEKCTVDNFEDKWRAAGPKLREKHYFEAMKRVCNISDMERQRRLVVLP